MANIYYEIRGRLAEHRDFGHALLPWLSRKYYEKVVDK